MPSKGARRRLKQRHKELQEDIEKCLQKSATPPPTISSLSNSALFTDDKDAHSISLFKINFAQQKSDIPKRIALKPKPLLNKRGVRKKVKPRNKAKLASRKAETFFDIWGDGMNENSVQTFGPLTPSGSRGMYRGQGLRPEVPAVQVEPNGCSFNPEPNSHQAMLHKRDQIEESKKKLSKKEVEEALNQEVLVDEMQQVALRDEEEDNDGSRVVYRPRILERKTKVQRNKETRHKEHLRTLEEDRRLKKLHKQINNAAAINNEISKQIKRSRLKSLARKEAQLKRMKLGLRRLGGKTIYNSQIEVISKPATSLRKLHASTNFALHRYVSIQKRGLIETGKFRGRKNRRRYKLVYPGEKERRIKAEPKSSPTLHNGVQELHSQLNQIKLSEGN